MDGPLSLEGRHEYMKSIKYKLLSFNVEIWLYAVKTEGLKTEVDSFNIVSLSLPFHSLRNFRKAFMEKKKNLFLQKN